MKQETKDTLLSMALGIFVIAVIIFLIVITLNQIGKTFDIPPANSSEEWKALFSDSQENPCKWYAIGCQKIACVVDCEEINRNAGEIICVC